MSESLARTLIADTPAHLGKEVKISGWVRVRRDHGKLVFLMVADRSGTAQVIFLPEVIATTSSIKDIRTEFVVEVQGLIKARPGKEGKEVDDIEIEAQSLAILGRPSEELPIDLSQNELDLQLETLLNNRTLSLRHKKVQAIFKLTSEMYRAYDEHLRSRGFMEIKTPKILSAATEGGANVFRIKYFERDAFLAQSPQFYKQAAMSAFERVFEIGPAYRAEPHFTTRHVNEYTSLDAEFGFISGVEEVMRELEATIFAVFRHLRATCAPELDLYAAAVPEEVPIPRLRLAEALAILKKEYGKHSEDGDIDAEGERLIGEYVKQKYNSDLVFLTHYPTRLRAFYSLPSPDNPEESESYDLIFRGLEIASGAERVSNYEELLTILKKRGLAPEQFSDYLDIFKYGVPRHGGWGLGSERIIQKLLDIKSIKEVILYPRDVKRLSP